MSDSDDAWKWALGQYLNSLRAAGVSVLPRVEVSDEEIAAWREAPLASSAQATSATSGAAPIAPVSRSTAEVAPLPPSVSAPEPRPTPAARSSYAPAASSAPIPLSNRVYPRSLDTETRVASLAVIESEVRECHRCPALAPKRTKTVFGEGSPNPQVLFFGEAPGEEEDKQGRPFVGAAGQLLTKMIEACGFQRSDVYILNSLKCRPPANRQPADSELENCCEYWQRQIDILQPAYIVCLGSFAIRSVIGPGSSISKLRGKFYQYGSSKVVATYHPSYLLRTPSAKKAAWEDLKMMLADMGKLPPK